jgi:hypothetical protein
MRYPARSECSGCGEVFAGLPAFDEHRTGSFRQGNRRCMTRREMQEHGFVRDEKGWWTLLTQEAAPWCPTGAATANRQKVLKS